MCQSKSDGGLRCTSHINEGMNKNNAAFNALVVEEIEANGYKGINESYKQSAILNAKKAALDDPKYQATVASLENAKEKVAEIENIEDMCQKGNHDLPEVYKLVRDSDPAYISLMAREQELLVLLHRGGRKADGNFNFKELNSSEADEFHWLNDKFKRLEHKNYTIAEKHLEIAKDSSEMRKEAISEVQEATSKVTATRERLEKEYYSEEYSKNVEGNPDYKQFSNKVEKSKDPRFIALNKRRTELSQQHYLTTENEKRILKKMSKAIAAGDVKQEHSAMAEVSQLKMTRAKVQYENIKGSTSGNKKEQLAKLKQNYNFEKKMTNKYNKLSRRAS